VTGLAAHIDYLYVSSAFQGRTYRFTLPEMYGIIISTPTGRDFRTWDIALESMGHIWVTSDDPDMPVRCCESTGRTLAFVSSDIIPSASGLTIDDTGKLWASCNEDGMIYGIDVGL
jgi:hypothetical protein